MQKKLIKIGMSPCPNDIFVFDALIHKRIDTGNYDFEFVFADIEQLNSMARNNELDIQKISLHGFAYVSTDYILMRSGNAIGFNCGPLIIGKEMADLKDIEKKTIAIPGKYTSAHLLLKLFLPEAHNKKEMLFSEIEDAIIDGKVDYGLIIHETRFTYQEKKLKKVADLGKLWENRVNLPVPLGGIVAKRSLPKEDKYNINNLIRESIKFAFANPMASRDFIKSKAQVTNDDVIKKHIELYVNNFSIDIGESGERAITYLLKKVKEQDLIPDLRHPIIMKKEKN